MPFHRYIFVFLCLISLTKNAFSQKNTLKLGRLDSRNGLSSNQVKCFLQDRYGFLWVGTRDGLNRYDGYNFKVYRPDPHNPFAILNAEIYCLFEDKKGEVWVGMQIGGAARYDRKRDRFISLAQDSVLKRFFEGKNVLQIAEDEEGNLYFATQEGLLRLDANRKTVKVFLEKENVECLYLDKNKHLWIGTQDSGLYDYDLQKQTFKNYQKSDQFPEFCDQEIVSIVEDRTGNLVLGTHKGLLFGLRKNNQIIDFQCFTPKENQANSLKSLKNSFVWLDSEGRLWVTENGVAGISQIGYHYENGKAIIDEIEQYLHNPLDPHSLASNRVRNLYADRLGLIWIPTEEGINYYSPSSHKFAHLQNYLMREPKGLNNNEVRAIYEEENDKIWISTYGGGVNICDLKNGICEPIPLAKDQQKLLKGRQLLKGLDNLLWSATSGGGMYAINMRSKKIEFVFEADPQNPKTLINNDVGAIYEDSDKTLWIGTEEGLCKISLENRKKGIFEDLRIWVKEKINTIIEDKAGYLWIATETEGLIRIRKNGTEKTVFRHNPTDSSSLAQNHIRVLYLDEQERIWVGTGLGFSLFLPKKQGFKNYEQKHGLTNAVVNGILADRDFLWIATNDGLFRFDLLKETLQHFTENEGLQGKEFRKRSFHKGKSGRFYFGGLNGLNYFDPRKIQIDTSTSKVLLTDFRLFNKSVEIGENSPLKSHISILDEMTLSYEDYVFSIHFSALYFSNPEKIQYAYQLENFEKNWNYVDSKQRMATYTNLDAGTYFFKVKAANANGLWQKTPTILKITVKPPFWKTTWFVILLITVVLASIIGYSKYRIEQIAKQKEKLARLVEIKTSELAKEKQEVEAKNHLLEEQKQEISLKNVELQQTQEEIVAQRDFISQKNETLHSTLEELKVKNQKITDSIRYAQTIQQAILPNTQKLERYLGEYFVLFRPKDMVSGDFYWITMVKEDCVIVAVADCTGHGVPGGFMSMIAYSLLNDIIKQKKILDPATILNELNQRWHEALMDEQKRSSEDGMDIGICRIDKGTEQSTITFCGAKMPLWYVIEGKMQEIQAVRKSIGSPIKTEKIFESQTFVVPPNTCLYLSSDGFGDQNDTSRQRFGQKRLKNFLLAHHQESFEEQKNKLEKALDSFRTDNDQRDDITVLGLRILSYKI